MSDLFDTRGKLAEGAQWRGTINVVIDGDQKELVVRQLNDPEFFKVMKMVDRDELSDLRNQLPADEMKEYRELQDLETLTEDEVERLRELEQKLESETTVLFDVLSEETFEGIRLAAKYAVEPDDADLKQALYEHADEIEEHYGIQVRQPQDCYEYCKDEIKHMIDNATNFVSFTIGLQALVATVDSEGN